MSVVREVVEQLMVMQTALAEIIVVLCEEGDVALPGGTSPEECEHPLDQLGEALPGSAMGRALRKRCQLCGQVVRYDEEAKAWLNTS